MRGWWRATVVSCARADDGDEMRSAEDSGYQPSESALRDEPDDQGHIHKDRRMQYRRMSVDRGRIRGIAVPKVSPGQCCNRIRQQRIIAQKWKPTHIDAR